MVEFIQVLIVHHSSQCISLYFITLKLVNSTTVSSGLSSGCSNGVFHIPPPPPGWSCHSCSGWLVSPSLGWLSQSNSGQNSNPHVCLGPVCVPLHGWLTQIASFRLVLVWFAPRLRLACCVDCSSSSMLSPVVGDERFPNNFLSDLTLEFFWVSPS